MSHTFSVKFRVFRREFLRSHSVYWAQIYRDNWNCYALSIFRVFILLASSNSDKLMLWGKKCKQRFACIVWTATARGGKSCSHTSNTVTEWLAERVGALNSSPPHSWILTSVVACSRLRSYLFTSATVPIGVLTAPKYGTKPIQYVPLWWEHTLRPLFSKTYVFIVPILTLGQLILMKWTRC